MGISSKSNHISQVKGLPGKPNDNKKNQQGMHKKAKRRPLEDIGITIGGNHKCIAMKPAHFHFLPLAHITIDGGRWDTHIHTLTFHTGSLIIGAERRGVNKTR
jgi:hypothetical protein